MGSMSPASTLTTMVTRRDSIIVEVSLPTTGRPIEVAVINLDLVCSGGSQFQFPDESPAPVGAVGGDDGDDENNDSDDDDDDHHHHHCDGSDNDSDDENKSRTDEKEASLSTMRRSIEEAADPELRFVDCGRCMKTCLVVADRCHRPDESEEEATLPEMWDPANREAQDESEEAALLAMRRSIEEAADPELRFVDCSRCMKTLLVVADRCHRRDESEQEASLPEMWDPANRETQDESEDEDEEEDDEDSSGLGEF